MQACLPRAASAITSARVTPPPHQAEPEPATGRCDLLQLRGVHRGLSQEDWVPTAPTHPVIKSEEPPHEESGPLALDIGAVAQSGIKWKDC